MRERREHGVSSVSPSSRAQPIELVGGCTHRALDGMHPTLRQVPPGGPRLSMQRVYVRVAAEVSQRKGSALWTISAELTPVERQVAEG